MNLYEHTIVARQDTSPSEIKQLTEKYSKIVEKNDGEIVKTENWGLLNLSYLIKKNKKGSYIHFKIKGRGNVVDELEKNEAIDKKLLRYLTIKVKEFDLDTNYFSKKDENEKKLEAQKIAEKINKKEFNVKKLSTENKELYGSVKPTEISKIIKEKEQLDIKPSMIQPIKEIKSLGKFKVKISLHSEIDAEILIIVESAETIQ